MVEMHSFHRGFLESARRAGLMADFFRQLNSSSQLLNTPTFDTSSLAKLQILRKYAKYCLSLQFILLNEKSLTYFIRYCVHFLQRK